MTNAANNLAGTVSLNPNGTGSASLSNSVATDLGNSTVGGTLLVTSGGSIAASGILSVSGAATLRDHRGEQFSHAQQHVQRVRFDHRVQHHGNRQRDFGEYQLDRPGGDHDRAAA
ncbi:MAG: hypothetical protein WDO24_06785 [Pseudomonadota bacterium]